MMIWGSFSIQTSSLSLSPSVKGSILFDKVQLAFVAFMKTPEAGVSVPEFSRLKA